MKETTIIKNGKLVTMDERESADWIVIEDGLIKALGNGGGYEDFLTEESRLIDAKGCTVLPGFVDSHFHMVKTAISEGYVSLAGAKNFKAVGKRIKAAAAKNRGRLILADKLDCAKLEEGRFPDRTVLDKYCNNAPVAIYSTDYHVLLLNTYGVLYYKVPFTLCGVEVDDKGVPTGIFRNQAGAKLDTNIVASFSDEQIDEAVSRVMPKLLSYGLTTVAAMEGGNIKLSFGDDYECEFIYQNLNRYPISMELFYQTTEIDRVLKMGLPRIGGALYLDGTMGARTAALTFDYADAAGKRGLLCFDQDTLNEFVTLCCKNGLQVALDAIGDAAIESALLAFEKAAESYDVRSRRHRIEHAELITAEQMKRAAKLGILLSMQPAYEGYWGSSDGMYRQRLGRRYGQTNQLREILDAGLMICGGSDSSVTEPNPLLGVHYAVNHPIATHRVSLGEALRMYTYNGAYGMFKEDEIGSLTPGKQADIVILERDLFSLRPEKLKDVKVAAVLKGGELLLDRGLYVKD